MEGGISRGRIKKKHFRDRRDDALGYLITRKNLKKAAGQRTLPMGGCGAD